MVRSCIVCGSKQGINPHLSFHRFPRNENLRKLWLQACHLTENDIKDRTILCSQHFVLDDDFDELYWPRRQLKIDAVPSPSLDHFKKHNTLKQPQNTTNCIERVQTISSSNNDESNERTGNIENFRNTNNREHEKSDILRVENLEIPEEGPYIVIIENSSPSSGNVSPVEITNPIQSPNLPNLSTGTVKEPRYFGDLKPEHFSTPENAQKRLALVNRIIDQKRKKIRRLNKENNRLKRRLINYETLLVDLHQNKLISHEILKKFKIRRFDWSFAKEQQTIVIGEEEEDEGNAVFVEN